MKWGFPIKIIICTPHFQSICRISMWAVSVSWGENLLDVSSLDIVSCEFQRLSDLEPSQQPNSATFATLTHSPTTAMTSVNLIEFM